MNHVKQITPITIRDIDFTVSRQIEQCPQTMMLRELVMNAVEAAAKAPSERRLVEIKGKAVPECGDARKLTIWNTGPGMSSSELDHICDLAASLGEDMALEGDFGMGAKVASLPSNTLGMRYRSCHNRVVSQVVLGKREGVYGKIWIPVDDSFEEVVDVTDQVRDEAEYRLDEDWTEVVLYGDQADQDTVADPYDGDPKQDCQWITTYLYHRFYGLPDGVEQCAFVLQVASRGS
ncbi:MAG: ATP-binding protein [Pelagibacterium sp.]|uniref:ATP-binding protein n=1 Tax=Pelagibacterium sp. TaxID=1967288 RepID=UPI0032EBCF38